MSLFDTTPPDESGAADKRPLAERMRPEQPGRLRRPGAHPRSRQAAAPADRARRTHLDHPVGTARGGQDDAGAPDRARDALRVHSVQRGAERHQGNQGGDGRCRAPAAPGPPHHSLHRRDSPLQQGAAGCVSALRGARRHHPDRRHHGESVVRSDLGAALAVAGVCAARADRAGDRRRCCKRALPVLDLRRQRRTAGADRASTPTATRAQAYNTLEAAAAASPDGRADRGACRTRCSARCCSTTRAAKSTST